MSLGKSRQKIDVEALLRWAFQDELPKRQISSADGMESNMGSTLGMLSELGITGFGSAENASQRYACFGTVHPDAIAVEAAVAALPDQAIDWTPENRYALLGDLVGLVQDRDVLYVSSLRTSVLVALHARRGCRPEWFTDAPLPKRVPNSTGQHAKLAGGVRVRSTFYTEGTYCPLAWTPSVLDVSYCRAEYVAWRNGLVMLVTALKSLSRWDVVGPAAAALPWSAEAEPLPKTLPSGVLASNKPLPLGPARKVAGPLGKMRVGQAYPSQAKTV